MKHRFYSKTRKTQFFIQAGIILAAFLIVFLAFLASWYSGIYLFGFLMLAITLSILAPFLDVPLLKKSGKLTYHSALFLSEKPHKGIIKIHGGTLFDYVFVIDKKMSGSQRTNFIMQQFAEGLLHLIETYENTKEENLIIRGTSYILNERTIKRMGFKVVETDSLQKIILIYNYVNLLITASLAKGKPASPKLSATKTFEARLDDLVKQKPLIRQLREKLKSVTSPVQSH